MQLLVFTCMISYSSALYLLLTFTCGPQKDFARSINHQHSHSTHSQHSPVDHRKAFYPEPYLGERLHHSHGSVVLVLDMTTCVNSTHSVKTSCILHKLTIDFLASPSFYLNYILFHFHLDTLS